MRAAPANPPEGKLSQEQLSKLGERLFRVDYVPRGPAWGWFAIWMVPILAIININTTNNIGWWFYLLALPPAFFAFLAVYKELPQAVEVYEHGVLCFDQKNLHMIPWAEMSYSECQWSGGDMDLHIGYRDKRRGGAMLFGSILKERAEELRQIINETAYPVMRRLWADAIKKDSPCEYRAVIVQREGLHFKKVRKLLRWNEMETYGVSDWHVYFNLPDGTRFRTDLDMTSLPWPTLLFRFAEEIRHAKR